MNALATRSFLKSRGWRFSRYSHVGCGHRGAWTKYNPAQIFGASLLYCLLCNRGIDIAARSREAAARKAVRS